MIRRAARSIVYTCVLPLVNIWLQKTRKVTIHFDICCIEQLNFVHFVEKLGKKAYLCPIFYPKQLNSSPQKRVFRYGTNR